MEVAVVTGANGAIGAAITEQFVRRGMTVLGVGRRADSLARVAAGSRTAGRGVMEPVVADLATDAGIAGVRSAIGGRTVVALVHSAGVDHVGTVASTTRAERLCSGSR